MIYLPVQNPLVTAQINLRAHDLFHAYCRAISQGTSPRFSTPENATRTGGVRLRGCVQKRFYTATSESSSRDRLAMYQVYLLLWILSWHWWRVLRSADMARIGQGPGVEEST